MWHFSVPRTLLFILHTYRSLGCTYPNPTLLLCSKISYTAQKYSAISLKCIASSWIWVILLPSWPASVLLRLARCRVRAFVLLVWVLAPFVAQKQVFGEQNNSALLSCIRRLPSSFLLSSMDFYLQHQVTAVCCEGACATAGRVIIM